MISLTAVLCAPSYGYVLVYNVTGNMKAAEWTTKKIISVSVKGYLAIDITDTNEADNGQLVLYGKDASGHPMYLFDYLDGGSDIYWETPGNVVAVDVWNWDKSPFYYDFVHDRQS